MTTPSAGELALLRTQPHLTKLHLSIYKPSIVFQAQVNEPGITKGTRRLDFNNVTTGSWRNVYAGMTCYVGSTPGGKDKGSIYAYWTNDHEIAVGENSHIDWEDDDYLTVVNFWQIWPRYPRYTQDGENVTVYKAYDVAYTDQNEILGSLVCMGPHHAGFLEGGEHQVYYTADGSENMNSEAMSYEWFFEGGTPTGSSSETPGNVTYDTPGHYSTRLTITTASGCRDTGFRHISIYDKPEEGTDVPILRWGLESLTGSRDEGGYTARVWVEEEIDDIEDGALVVIFAEDWYGATKQSIGGNANTRQQTVFVGYILGDTIEYDYENSRVTFEVGSPSEVMKRAEAFSVSVEDSENPTADATDKGGSPWFYMVGLSVKTAIWHYFRWHSTVAYCMDVKYSATDFLLQYFDADRTSLYDAVNSLMESAVVGKAICDRQGKLWLEIDTPGTVDSLTTAISLFDQDWIGRPMIEERHVNDVSYLEAGGVAYDGTNFQPLLACAPGVTPAYRGSLQRISGLALTSQGQLNTLVGSVYEYKNSKYPRVSLDIAGNYRIFDIAPQEQVKLTLASEDTHRKVAWAEKSFVLRSIYWQYDPQNGAFRPTIDVAEKTTAINGESIIIPLEPPSSGFDVPPIQIPPFPPIEPISLPSVGGGDGSYYAPPLVGYDASTSTSSPIRGGSIGALGVRLLDGVTITAGGLFVTPAGYSGNVTITALVRVFNAGGNIYVRNAINVVPNLVTGDDGSGVASALTAVSDSGPDGGLGILQLLPVSVAVSGASLITPYFTRVGGDGADTCSWFADFYGWLIAYS